MKAIYFCLGIALLFSVENISAQSMNCLWQGLGFINSTEPSSSLNITETFTDKQGNYYTATTFRVRATIGDSTFTTPNENGRFRDVFISKYTPAGNLIWAKRANLGAGNLYASVDAKDFVHVVGSVTRFDNIMRDSILDVNNGEIFYAKYNSNLELQTFQQIPSTYATAIDIVLDRSGNRYISFYLGVSGGMFDVPFPDTTYKFRGSASDLFIVKYDSIGQYKWSKKFKAKNISSVKLATDSTGNLFFSGTYSDSLVIFNQNFHVNSSNNYHFFVSKLNVNGGLVWVKEYGGDYQDYCYDLFINKKNDVYLAGSLGSTSVRFGDTTFSKFQGVFDPFFAKLDNATGAVKLVVREEAGISTSAVGKAVTEDASGNIFFGGRYRGFESRFGDSTIRGSQVYDDLFINQYDSTGRFKYFYTAPGTCNEDVVELEVINNQLMVAGYYTCDINFCGTTFTKATEFVNLRNVFVTRLKSRTTAVKEVFRKADIVEVFPNPADTHVQLSAAKEWVGKEARLELFDMQGKYIINQQMILKNNQELPVHTLPPGVYVLRVSNEQFLQTLQFVKK